MNGGKIVMEYGVWFRQGLSLFKDNASLLVIASLLALVISGATATILAGPMLAGLIVIALALFDRRSPQPDVGEVFKGFDYFQDAFLIWLVWGLIAFVVMAALNFLPSIIGKGLGWMFLVLLETFLMFAMFLIVDRKMEFWPASVESINRVKANFAPLFCFVLILHLVVGISGVLTCGLGMVVTLPYAVCCMAAAYRAVYGPPPAGA